MSFLLDTSVISELVKAAPDNNVIEWLKRTDEASLYLSVLTIGEIEKGIAKLPESSRREKLETWVRRDLADRFRERLLAIDGTVAATWGRLAGEAEARGEPLPVIDVLIAATSLAHDLTVATRNIGDFERCGARCFNPWLNN
ncbi:MAG TPA: type II toxin-antitoxin system VapC family toxin [Burkholderiales bacterium]|nr:type II toxin-antitoxin system VapC family toxin [Burkholderiales bacterium]